jgi:hypothetical protein
MKRAQQTDPILPRRKARERLAATLAKLRTASAAERSALLLDWQRDAAAVWEIPQAAPAPFAFSDATWSTLWKESDRSLYGTDAALPADWTKRAETALATKRVPGFRPSRLFLPRNLAPFLFTLVLTAALFSPKSLPAQDPASAYHAGDFSNAEKAWRDTLAKVPTDSIARHNLSLALAQQDRWNEAAAHSAVAFVQNPADPAVRWQFALTAEKAGTVPAPLAAFLQPGPARALASCASPANWQRITMAAACGAALALGVMLFNAYGRRTRGVWWTTFVFFGFFSALATVGFFGAAAYGTAADARAVITWRAGTLRSIPTEADTAQKTTPLSAGMLAITDKVFPLGWVRLSFENGQTGWVRKEEVVPLWK